MVNHVAVGDWSFEQLKDDAMDELFGTGEPDTSVACPESASGPDPVTVFLDKS
jgi:hypothetical protein